MFGNALGNAAIAGIEAENARNATKPVQAPIEINPSSPQLQVSDLNMPLAPVSPVPSDYIVQQDGTSGLPHGTVTVEPLQILSEGDGTAENPTGNDYENLFVWASKYGMAPPPNTNDEALLNGYRQSMGAAVGQQWAAWSDLYASMNSPDQSVGTSADQGFFGDVEGTWKAWQDGSIGLGDALASVGDSMAYRLRGANRDYQLTTRAGGAIGTIGFGVTTVASGLAAVGTSETGAGAVGFGALAVYSADQTQASFRTMISGEPVEPAGAQLFEASGMSPIVANGLYAMPGLVVPAGDVGEAETAARWIDAVESGAAPKIAMGNAGVAEIPNAVSTPFGDALQSMAPEALAMRSQVDQGATLYRLGTTGKSETEQAQFWSLENPLNPGYAARYGVPPSNVANADFIETATLKPGALYITRPAPGVGTNPGGGIEVITEPGGVRMNYFGTH